MTQRRALCTTSAISCHSLSGHIVVSSFVCALSDLRFICVTAFIAQGSRKQLSEFHPSAPLFWPRPASIIQCNGGHGHCRSPPQRVWAHCHGVDKLVHRKPLRRPRLGLCEQAHVCRLPAALAPRPSRSQWLCVLSSPAADLL